MVIEGGNGPRRKGTTPAQRRGPRVEEPRTVLRLPDDPYATEYPRRAQRSRRMLSLVAITVAVAVIIAIASNKSKPAGQTAATVGAGTTAGVGGGESAPPGSTQQSAGATSGGTSAGTSAGTGSGTGDPAQQFTAAQFPASTGLHGVLIGYPDTQNGAEAAAANFVAAYGSEAMLHPSSRQPLVHAIADPAIEKALQGQLDTAFNVVDTSLGLDKQGNPPSGQSVISRAFPVGFKSVSYSKSKAVVAIWADTIAGDAGTGSNHPVVETWATITLTLTWVNGDWKWNSFSQAEGPTPVYNQVASSPDDLQKAVSQFMGLRYAP